MGTIKSLVLLGSSQGGLVSAILAEQLQDAVASMVLFYPAFNIPELVKMFAGLGGGSWGNGSWDVQLFKEANVNFIRSIISEN